MNLNIEKTIDYYVGGFLLLVVKPVVYAIGKILRRDHTLTIRGRILFIKMMGGGSLLLALPLILGLKQANPSKSVWIVTTPSVKPFAEILGAFDRIIIIEDRSIHRLILTAAKALLQCLAADTVIDLEVHSRLTTLFSLFTMARNRLGFYLESVFWRKNLHTHLIFYNCFSPSYFFYEQFAYMLKTEPTSQKMCRTHLLNHIPESTEKKKGTYTICIGASCSSLGEERMLTPRQWLYVFEQRLTSSDDATVFFLGGNRDSELADAIIVLVEKRFPYIQFFNRCGSTSLTQAIAILYHADAFWGIDSALLHFARLMKINCVSFWGPSAPETRLRVIEGLTEEILYQKIPCSPCIHVTEIPPCRGNNLCIKALFDTSVMKNEDLTSVIGIK